MELTYRALDGHFEDVYAVAKAEIVVVDGDQTHGYYFLLETGRNILAIKGLRAGVERLTAGRRRLDLAAAKAEINRDRVRLGLPTIAASLRPEVRNDPAAWGLVPATNA